MKLQDERSKILQQELSITQHGAQQNEKLIVKLKDEFKAKQKSCQVLEAQAHTRHAKLHEMEFKVGKLEMNKNIDVDKVVEVLLKQT